MNEFLRRALNLPPQASSVARDVDMLHYFVIAVTLMGSLVVALICVYFVIRYRRSGERGHPGPTGGRRTSTLLRLEILFVALLLGCFTGWWIVGYRQYTHMQKPPTDALDVYVIAKKWMWTFAYPEGGASNEVLYVPADRPVRLVMASRDVIHSFYVPAFRVKQDVVPGRVTTTWFEATQRGTFPILCAEYCGTGHSTMSGTIVVLGGDDYARRVQSLPGIDVRLAGYEGDSGSEPSMATLGRSIASDAGCLRCHTVDGTPHIGPTWAGSFGREVLFASGKRQTVDAAYLTESMMDPRARIRAGFQPVMPSYRGYLTAAEAGAIVEYIRSLKDASLSRPAPLAPDLRQQAPIELPRRRDPPSRDRDEVLP